SSRGTSDGASNSRDSGDSDETTAQYSGNALASTSNATATPGSARTSRPAADRAREAVVGPPPPPPLPPASVTADSCAAAAPPATRTPLTAAPPSGPRPARG